MATNASDTARAAVAHLENPVVSDEQRRPIHSKIKRALVARPDAYPHAGGYQRQPFAPLHTEHTGDGPDYYRTVRTADDRCIPAAAVRTFDSPPDANFMMEKIGGNSKKARLTARVRARIGQCRGSP